jgi:cyclopropane-fatty-acyl-phospholipid synthase
MTTETQPNVHSGSISVWQRSVSRMASKADYGSLTLVFPNGAEAHCQGRYSGPRAAITINSWRLLWRIWSRGDLGFAEAYMAGDCDTPDLRELMAWALANEARFSKMMDGGFAAFSASLVHRLRPNTRSGSRRNIRRHYDLSNTFYETWLDASMTYSSAWFGGDLSHSLEAAQNAKYARIAEMAGITSEHHVLEIGCGWGGFCAWAAREIGCHVTAVTISSAQHGYAQDRIRAEGLDHLVDIRLMDYRDIADDYDVIVSIEMIEAVGEKFWPVYANVLQQRLRPGGRAVLQAITINADSFEGYRNRADFIQAHVFPGGMLPTNARLDDMALKAGLKPAGRLMFGGDYAETLRRWRLAFEAAWPAIEKLDFDERFRRMWRYYLVYCEAGFDVGRIDVGLFAMDRT